MNSTPKWTGSPGGKAFDEIRNFERLAAGLEREAFGDSHLPIGDVAIARKLHLHPIRVAPQPGFERSVDEIAPLFVLAVGDRLGGDIHIK